MEFRSLEKMEKENEHYDADEHDIEPKWKGPLKIIGSLFLLLIMVSWVVPYYSVKLNPEPKEIPSLIDVQSQFLNGVEIGNETGINDIREAAAMLDTRNPVIKQVATSIVTQSCPSSKICHAKALYYFVRDNIKYVSDPYEKEYIASPVETLKTGGGDCDDGALLLAAMIEAVGIESRIVVIPGHAMIKAMIPDAANRYKIKDWVYLDWTCKECGFGEMHYQNVLQLSD